MQGLGSGAISLAGTPRAAGSATCRAWRAARRSRPSRCPSPRPAPTSPPCSARARIEGDHAVLDGEKTWISNGGIADFYVVFARTGEAPGARGISAFIVDAGTPGFEIAERIDVIAPHPLARLRFTNCRVPLSQRIGEAGEGFKVAMRTLDVFRTSVAAAALGFARRAMDEALQRATTRKMFGQTLARLPAHAGQAGADGDHHRQRRAADLPRRLAARPGPQRDPRSGDGQAGRHRRRAAGDRRRGADVRRRWAWSAGSRSSGCTARSARCASTKARPKCSS